MRRVPQRLLEPLSSAVNDLAARGPRCVVPVAAPPAATPPAATLPAPTGTHGKRKHGKGHGKEKDD